MTTYARIANGAVAETYLPPSDSGIVPGQDGVLTGLPGDWIALTANQAETVSDNWLYDGGSFSPPPILENSQQLSKAELLAQIQALMARVEALPDDPA
jgi:hypothetical protein